MRPIRVSAKLLWWRARTGMGLKRTTSGLLPITHGPLTLVGICLPRRCDHICLRSYLSAVLPDYMVPSAYVLMEAFPLTPNGKLDRKALPAPDGDAYARQVFEAPQGEIEATIAAVWSELLGVETISRHDSFFALGGHSLLAVRMIARLKDTLGVEMAVQEIFQRKQLSDFAEYFLHQKPLYNSVVQLSGTPGKTGLFCVHTIGSHIEYYRPLAEILGQDFVVYGLRSPPNWCKQNTENLNDLIKMHVDAIIRTQAHGPYQLLGWSAGGRIALAIAAELESRGETVNYVGLLDIPVPTIDAKNLLALWADMIEALLASEFGIGLSPGFINALRSVKNPADRQAIDDVFASASNDIREVLSPYYELFIQRAFQMGAIATNALPMIHAPLHFIWAAASGNWDASLTFDWTLFSKQAANNVHQHIDADHVSIIQMPRAAEVSRMIVSNAKINESIVSAIFDAP
ncbi:non-ribosomal peptide synthetase [Rhizobium leguminosarum]|nr:non-ribosomal peptide synthetase [Rhizobium leguminosarum]